MSPSPMYDLLKDEYANFIDTETVSYEGVVGVKARKCVPEQKELDKAEFLSSQQDVATFIMWDTTLSDTTPEGGGRITRADGTVWTIVARWQEAFETQWRCLCVKDV